MLNIDFIQEANYHQLIIIIIVFKKKLQEDGICRWQTWLRDEGPLSG